MTDVMRERAGAGPSESRRGGTRFRRAFGLLCAGAVVGLTIGFLAFAHTITSASPPANVRAQGIVVLTGGSARINGALQLLAERRAERLLISGVNPMVTHGSLATVIRGDLGDELHCCVDLGHEARDTIGNASEARLWAESQGFSSLIVVTSAYHMPRGMAELRNEMPEAELIAYPVSNPDLHLDQWWHDPEAFGLLVREYGKYLLTTARQALVPQVRQAAAATNR